jgi:hypothetical protein
MPEQRPTRRIWVSADAHIGFEADGRDGAGWLALAVEDVQENLPPVDIALFLGDCSHAYKPEQFQRYVEIRDGSRVPFWYQIVGNHDYHGTESGDYQRIVGGPFRFTLIDGNVAWICFSVERGRAAGRLSPATRDWLAGQLARHQDRNVVVCSHQLVYGTVAGSDRVERYLHPRRAVSDLLAEYRVDLWLGGHWHARPPKAGDAVHKNGTTFINVASVSHIYGTQGATGFLLEAEDGGHTMRARCRIHDERRFHPDLDVTVPFPRPFDLAPMPEGGPEQIT